MDLKQFTLVIIIYHKFPRQMTGSFQEVKNILLMFLQFGSLPAIDSTVITRIHFANYLTLILQF